MRGGGEGGEGGTIEAGSAECPAPRSCSRHAERREATQGPIWRSQATACGISTAFALAAAPRSSSWAATSRRSASRPMGVLSPFSRSRRRIHVESGRTTASAAPARSLPPPLAATDEAFAAKRLSSLERAPSLSVARTGRKSETGSQMV